MEESDLNSFEATRTGKVNPLFSMSKDELLNLNGRQYNNLIKLSMDQLHEAERFCINLVEIIESHLLVDHRLIASMVNSLDDKLKEVIFSSLKRIYNNNKVKLAVIECLDDPTSERFQQLFLEVYEIIFNTNELDLLLNYLKNLCYLNKINTNPIILNNDLFNRTLDSLLNAKVPEFYCYLLNLNIMPENKALLRSLQRRLMTKGTDLDKYVIRTGKLDAKWHDLQNPVLEDLQKQRMLHFFSFDIIKLFAFQAIKRQDLVDATLYLDLLVTKFERISTEIENSVFVIENSETIISNHVSDILRVVLFHLMTFKGPDQCIKILNYMIKNKLEISFEMILTMMTNLRKQGCYDEAIALINSIKLSSIAKDQKHSLVVEVFQLMCNKFRHSPKIILGYLNMFRYHEDVTKLLNELRLLGMVYEQTPNQIKIPAILAANVDKHLTDVKFTHETLCDIYEVVFDNYRMTPEIVEVLFNQYLNTLKLPSAVKFNFKLSDRVLTLCLNHLLKVPPSNLDMIVTKNRNNYELAKSLAVKFYQHISKHLKPQHHLKLRPYPFDLLIYSGLVMHNDYSFACQLIKASTALKLPFTFNQVYPFIMYYYQQQQYDKAKSWYNVLVSHGLKATNNRSKDVYKVAKDLQWEVSGFLYRSFTIRRNHARREALMNLDKDGASFLAVDDSKSEVSLHDDLIVSLQHSYLKK